MPALHAADLSSLDLRHLRAIVAIADHGSIGGAARRLGLTQPALSVQLRRVEQRLGRSLYARLPDGVRATPAGELVVGRARAALHELEELAVDLDQLADRSGLLAIGGIASDWYGAFLAWAVRELPRGVDSHNDTSTTVLDEWLAAERIDLALVVVHEGDGQAAPRGARQRTVIPHAPYLVALGSDHPLADREEVGLHELADTPWLLPRGRADGPLPAFLDACAEAGFVPVAPIGSADLSHHIGWVAEQGAASLCSPAFRPPAGVVAVPMRGSPVVGELRARWNPRRVCDAEVDLVRAQLAGAYADQVLLARAASPTWERRPEHRPRLAPDLRQQVSAERLRAFA